MPMTDAAACRFVAGYYGSRAADVHGLGTGEWSRAYVCEGGGEPPGPVSFSAMSEDQDRRRVGPLLPGSLECIWSRIRGRLRA
jgi:hypothetical protein